MNFQDGLSTFSWVIHQHISRAVTALPSLLTIVMIQIQKQDTVCIALEHQ